MVKQSTAETSTNEAKQVPQKVKSKKQKKMSFAQAQDVYLRLKQEKEEEKQRERAEREKRNETIAATNKSRKKMNQALAKRNKKGQPNLNAQMDVLLEKIQKRVDKEKKGTQ
ncbi:Protein CBG16573 [Caenorhabditis briggsae]|uniref:Protein CBG16573 n=2 Tax=Caenorhabditis briggsae TaxID=6238 RepID=A8XPI2_CAEBR|nr:Protein CBG16573 [Caenorhabditis briggsae]ULU01136.1 hypothetical protein L3Y34_001481 [Caenorhabditis briggsae]CAP34503.1 Protein CBG16573 [Caenorhabditis briggsae]